MNTLPSGGNLAVEILETASYIRIAYKDIINLENQKCLGDLVCDIRNKTEKTRFIVDTRGCAVNYSILDRYQAAAYLADKYGPEIIIAYIVDQVQNKGISENTCHNRGGTDLKVVADDKEALSWIGVV